MRSLVLLLASLTALMTANPSKSKTFPCVVQNHYIPQEYIECDTQCYAIKVRTPTEIRTIRQGCAGKDDMIERARFDLEHRLVFTTTDCGKVGSGTLRRDENMTLMQHCCTTPFCNGSSGSALLLPLLISLIAYLVQ